jgi:hypothetical protein
MDLNLVCVTGRAKTPARVSVLNDRDLLEFEIEIVKGFGAHEHTVTFHVRAFGWRHSSLAGSIHPGVELSIIGDVPDMRVDGGQSIKAHQIILADGFPYVSGQRIDRDEI